ncbi:MAG: amidohydrolase family protein [Saprospiraceae bacterium]|nr:amidohydrolase family protein [Saprospiraceae bacterium]
MMTARLFFLFLTLLGAKVQAQFQSEFSDIPRIDVHTHVANDIPAISRYFDVRNILLDQHAIDLAFWINLGDGDTPIIDLDTVLKAGKGRMSCAISDYTAHDGLMHSPSSLKGFMDQGFVGYKIWSGPWYRVLKNKEEGYPYVDDLAHEPTFAEMERIGMVGASIHVADPNGPWNDRGDWLTDPIEYWKEITAWHTVLTRHPDLKVVMAHSNWLICQDAQIDYLRYLLATFPNLNLDLAATFQYFYMVSHDNLRAFIIEWSDRILFGTDIGSWSDDAVTAERAQQYLRAFKILETSEIVNGGFFGGPEIQGLTLPREVLEKIYYKNALRIYPGVGEKMIKLGYQID